MSETGPENPFLEIMRGRPPVSGLVKEITTIAFGNRQLFLLRLQTDNGEIREFLISDARIHQHPPFRDLMNQRLTIPEIPE